MATRRDIREAFYAELETAASGLVDASNISQEDPDDIEETPSISHTDNYREVPMNNKTGIAEHDESGGSVTAVHRVQMMEARFSLLIVSDDEQEKEDIYEAVRTYFEAYEFPNKDTSALQSDATLVRVRESNSQDSDNRDPPMRGDRIAIDIQFKRFYSESVDAIDQIDTGVDADNDGTLEYTYSTT